MRRNLLHWTLMALLTIGGICTSCSSNDEPQPVEESVSNPLPDQLKGILTQLNQEMQSVDYTALQQLSADLAATGTRISTRSETGEENETDPSIIQNLLDIINGLLPDVSTSERNEKIYSFVNAQETLEMVLTLFESSCKDEEGDKELNRGQVLEIIATPSDTTSYEITLRNYQGVSEASNQQEHFDGVLLDIIKNGETLLNIWAIRGISHEMTFLADREILHSGMIEYQGNSILIEVSHCTDREPVTIKVYYKKNDNTLVTMDATLTDNQKWLPDAGFCTSMDCKVNVMNGLLGLNGHVESMGFLATDVASVAYLSKNGGSESVCQKLTQVFNKNMSLSIVMAGSELGQIQLGYRPMETEEKFKPVIVVASPLFGNTPLTFDEVLATMGMTWDDILSMLGGSK